MAFKHIGDPSLFKFINLNLLMMLLPWLQKPSFTLTFHIVHRHSKVQNRKMYTKVVMLLFYVKAVSSCLLVLKAAVWKLRLWGVQKSYDFFNIYMYIYLFQYQMDRELGFLLHWLSGLMKTVDKGFVLVLWQLVQEDLTTLICFRLKKHSFRINIFIETM